MRARLLTSKPTYKWHAASEPRTAIREGWADNHVGGGEIAGGTGERARSRIRNDYQCATRQGFRPFGSSPVEK